MADMLIAAPNVRLRAQNGHHKFTPSHRDCRVLVTAGPVEIDPVMVPENAIVVGRVPHGEIMLEAALTATYAGRGAAIASLKYGVPLICPAKAVANQPVLASQVEFLRCGLLLNDEDATPVEIIEAVDRLLNDPYCPCDGRNNFSNAGRIIGGHRIRDPI